MKKERKGKKEKKIEYFNCTLKIVGKKYSKIKKRSVASYRKRVTKPRNFSTSEAIIMRTGINKRNEIY